MPRFREDVNLQRVETRTGAAAGALSLADRLEEFENQQTRIAGKQAIQRGLETARGVTLETDEQGITQAPELKKPRFIGGIEITAHNKALRAAYVASLGNDVKTEIGRIKAENPDDLISFNDAAEGFAKGIISSVEPGVRDLVIEDIDDKITAARITVQAADIQKQNDLAFQELQESEKSALDSAALEARNGNIEASAKELVVLSGILQGQIEAGFITQPQAREKMRSAELRATQESVVGAIRSLTDSGQHIKALESAEKIRQKVPKGMTVDEHETLYKSILSDISESLSIKSKLEDSEELQLKKKQSATETSLYLGVLDGSMKATDITNELSQGNLKQEQAEGLINVLQNRGRGVDDWPLVNSIQEAIEEGEGPEAIKQAIIANTGTRLTEATANGLLNSLTESEDDESVLKTSRVKRARDFITPSMRITGPLGALDTEAERRLARAKRSFDERVLSGEDPWQVADELVGKDAFDRKRRPQFGTKDNLEEAQKLLDEKALANEIDKDTYEFENKLLQDLKVLKHNIDAFDKAKKEANLNARE